jgi:callose synthase
MGLLQTFPLFFTLAVEKGVLFALLDIGQLVISGGPLYFIFQIQTKSYYFAQTILAGGAAYRATGRGFVTRHSAFSENYRFFATSHLYLGLELTVGLVLFGVFTQTKQYAGTTWALWLSSISFLFAPFWFNPLAFEWHKVHFH